jgi:hypothetical protein
MKRPQIWTFVLPPRIRLRAPRRGNPILIELTCNPQPGGRPCNVFSPLLDDPEKDTSVFQLVAN